VPFYRIFEQPLKKQSLCFHYTLNAILPTTIQIDGCSTLMDKHRPEILSKAKKNAGE